MEQNFKNNGQIIVFKLDQEEYAITIDVVKEVVLTSNIVKIPQTPSYIQGISNIRGSIIPIVDLGIKFGLIENNQEYPYTLIVENGGTIMGILVKEVPDTLSIQEDMIDSSPNFLDTQNYIQGIVKDKDRIILLIDVFKIISEENLNRIREN